MEQEAAAQKASGGWGGGTEPVQAQARQFPGPAPVVYSTTTGCGIVYSASTQPRGGKSRPREKPTREQKKSTYAMYPCKVVCASGSQLRLRWILEEVPHLRTDGGGGQDRTGHG